MSWIRLHDFSPRSLHDSCLFYIFFVSTSHHRHTTQSNPFLKNWNNYRMFCWFVCACVCVRGLCITHRVWCPVVVLFTAPGSELEKCIFKHNSSFSTQRRCVCVCLNIFCALSHSFDCVRCWFLFGLWNESGGGTAFLFQTSARAKRAKLRAIYAHVVIAWWLG